MRDPGPRDAESLGLHRRPQPLPEPLADLRGERLEFSSRGDRVPARLLLPGRGTGPFPLVLLGHGAGGSKEAGYLDALAAPWVRAGAAALSLDLPLHGERHNEKLAEPLRASRRRPAGASPAAVLLWTELVEQSAADLERSLDAAALLPEIDPGRIVYAAFSLGAILGAPFLARDPRPRAAALALGGCGLGPPGPDPALRIAGFAPRPLLFVNASRDATVSREAAEALHAAAGEPKRVDWFDATHADLPGRALKAMWQFLRSELGL